MKVEHQIRAFQQIFNKYDGVLPLHRFLFTYFKQNKQMGSSDRRWATRYIYVYFRLGKALPAMDQVLRLAIADFLCSQTLSLVIESQLPLLKGDIQLDLPEKLKLIKAHYPEFQQEDIFSFKSEASQGLEKQAFCLSHFIQPDLFLRVKPAELPLFVTELEKQEITFEQIGESTLALPNGAKLEKILVNQKHYQVQDLSSQKTGIYFRPEPWDYWWDCCAASGGKSLLLHSLEPKVQLLVSDVRENSLSNLEERFEEAGLKKYQKKVLDLLQNNAPDLHHYEFDGIILDAPCTGSGTWGRTPEMLYYFDEHKVAYFSKLQKSITANVVKYLKQGKPLVYITCSVFQQENEEVVQWMLDNLPLKLEKMELIKGYAEKADSMFVARLIKQAD